MNNINLKEKISIVIAAAGKGTRSKLDYPKSLYKINNQSILQRIINTLSEFGSSPIIIVSPSGHDQILDEIKKIKVKCSLLVQKDPLGMGDAVIQLRKINSELKENILLIWGDVPFISPDTINRSVEAHFKNKNCFTFPTIFSEDQYTVVKRDKSNRVKSVLESKNNPEIASTKIKERDLGVFIFRKDTVLDLLEKDLPGKFNKLDDEHGFLYIIDHLYKFSKKIGTVEVSDPKEALSLNAVEDLKGR